MHIRVLRTLRTLKRDFPLPHPVRVRTVETLMLDGHRLFGCMTMTKNDDVFLITLQRHPDISVQVDTLWHEWSHCLLWPRCKYRHSARFWAAYGQIYSHYQD